MVFYDTIITIIKNKKVAIMINRSVILGTFLLLASASNSFAQESSDEGGGAIL